MSKAFTRESDDDFAARPPMPPRPSLPPGTRNYITRPGADAMREELSRLVREERPRLDRAARPEEWMKVEQRILLLEEILRTTEPVDIPQDQERVRFGLTVRVRSGGEEECYRIVGVDEIDLDRGWISWQSPLARALLNRSVGERVKFRSPSGERVLEIVSLSAD